MYAIQIQHHAIRTTLEKDISNQLAIHSWWQRGPNAGLPFSKVLYKKLKVIYVDIYKLKDNFIATSINK